MKRRIIMLLIFLLIGAIVNIAMTAGLWFWGERPTIGTPKSFDQWRMRPCTSLEVGTWQRFMRNDWPPAPERCLDQSTFGMRFRRMAAIAASFDPTNMTPDEWLEKAKNRSVFSINSVECGWPLPWVSADEATEQVGIKQTVRLRNGSYLGRVWVPNEFSLANVALNTLFYAAILWLLLALPGALRRWRRIKRGLCPACAYPVGASDLCTSAASR